MGEKTAEAQLFDRSRCYIDMRFLHPVGATFPF